MKLTNLEKVELENLIKGKTKPKDKLLENLVYVLNKDKNILKKLLALLN
jgi:hypothetical protein